MHDESENARGNSTPTGGLASESYQVQWRNGETDDWFDCAFMNRKSEAVDYVKQMRTRCPGRFFRAVRITEIEVEL